MKNKGFTLIELMIVVAIIAIIAAIAIPNLLASRKAANETATIGSLRGIFSAEQQFKLLKKKGNNFGTLDELSSNGLFTQVDPSGNKSGYNYKLTTSTSGTSFSATASPITNDEGDKYYGLFSDGRITYSTTATAPNQASSSID